MFAFAIVDLVVFGSPGVSTIDPGVSAVSSGVSTVNWGPPVALKPAITAVCNRMLDYRVIIGQLCKCDVQHLDLVRGVREYVGGTVGWATIAVDVSGVRLDAISM